MVQLVNTLMTVWTTGGVRLKTMTLQALIGSDHRLVDPRVLFDASVGRWFVLVTDVTADSYGIKIGVSQTTDPSGAWWFYTWDSPAVSSACLDQPRLGYSSLVVAFSANVYDACNSPPFGPTYVGTELWALNKAQLVAGQRAEFVTWRPSGQLWSVEPAQSLSASDVEYAAAVEGAVFRVVTITGVPPAATSYTSTDLPIAIWPIPATRCRRARPMRSTPEPSARSTPCGRTARCGRRLPTTAFRPATRRAGRARACSRPRRRRCSSSTTET